MKFKGANVVKHYDGERYVFKKGVALVPGVRMCKKPVYITLKEFNAIVNELKINNL